MVVPSSVTLSHLEGCYETVKVMVLCVCGQVVHITRHACMHSHTHTHTHIHTHTHTHAHTHTHTHAYTHTHTYQFCIPKISRNQPVAANSDYLFQRLVRCSGCEGLHQPKFATYSCACISQNKQYLSQWVEC